MSRVSLRPAAELDVEVELGDDLFTPVIVTRSRKRQVDALDRQMRALQSLGDDEAPEDIDDQLVGLIGQLLDVWLAPQPGKRRKPSQIIERMWKGDELALPQLFALMDDIAEAAGRPT